MRKNLYINERIKKSRTNEAAASSAAYSHKRAVCFFISFTLTILLVFAVIGLLVSYTRIENVMSAEKISLFSLSKDEQELSINFLNNFFSIEIRENKQYPRIKEYTAPIIPPFINALFSSLNFVSNQVSAWFESIFSLYF